MRLTRILSAIAITLICNALPASAQEIVVGSYTFRDGGEYQGELFKGRPWGKGKTVYKNGDIYEGEYQKGKRHGYGIYTFADGERYEGEWFQDQQHGTGTFYFRNNNKYQGLWFRDFQQGTGTMYYYNGDKYEGNWLEDKREGAGVYTYRVDASTALLSLNRSLDLEIIGNPIQNPTGNLVVIHAAPKQLEIKFTPPLALRDCIVIETLTKLV